MLDYKKRPKLLENILEALSLQIGSEFSYNARAQLVGADKGALWENDLISERIKKQSYEGTRAKYYFWKTTQQQELDFLEQQSEEVRGFEFKWNGQAKVKISKTFLRAYPDAAVKVITKANYEEFLIG
ncbi:MAG: putative AAA+ superfamily ATPase [Arcticibacterium sp.]|jgi:predicted AAA+ superfamily ATPase